MDDDDAIVQEFLTESNENLDNLDSAFVELERDPANREILGSIFRTVHTIKGTSGFLGFSKLEALTHVGENLLSKLRDGALSLDAEMVSALLAMVDAIREILGHVGAGGGEGDGEYGALVARLSSLVEPHAAAAPPPAASANGAPAAPRLAEILIDEGKVDREQVMHALAEQAAGDPRRIGEILVEQGAVRSEDVREALREQGPTTASPPRLGEILLDEGIVEQGELLAAIEHQVVQRDPRRIGEILVEQGAAQPGEVLDALHKQAQSQARAPSAENSIRVDVSLLDTLMNLVGELVLARNQILQHSAMLTDTAFLATTQRLNLITTELQGGVMKTRMQPIGNVWNKFPRVVRDLSSSCHKQVRLEMEGQETELDKTILESIKDPLTHIVRNSIDHGIEPPDERTAAGKPAEGVLRLRAFHEGGQVNIEIADDGHGIDPAKIRAKALEKNVITPDQAGRMSDRELIGLVFAPGFSTAAKVTNVSGRGVGMDVVKTNIERIGGTIDIQSRVGEGTVLKIKIPLTLAIIPALVVTSGGERYAIPQVSLLELVRLEGEQARAGIERIHAAPVYRLRGNLLPLVYLNRMLGLEAPDTVRPDVVNIVVLQADDRHFGLVVDEVNDTEEIVVKPLGQELKGLSAFAGATIMGDGRVALILDVLGIGQNANVVSESRDKAKHERIGAESEQSGDRETLLLFSGGGRRASVPLSVVSRLEELPVASVEQAGAQRVAQYRGRLLPLFWVSELLDLPPIGASAEDATVPSDTLQVVVSMVGERSVGFVVDEILDVVEDVVRLERCADVAGIVGSTVIHERVTDVIDVGALLAARAPGFGVTAADGGAH